MWYYLRLAKLLYLGKGSAAVILWKTQYKKKLLYMRKGFECHWGAEELDAVTRSRSEGARSDLKIGATSKKRGLDFEV